jgi:hypothetical protein
VCECVPFGPVWGTMCTLVCGGGLLALREVSSVISELFLSSARYQSHLQHSCYSSIIPGRSTSQQCSPPTHVCLLSFFLCSQPCVLTAPQSLSLFLCSESFCSHSSSPSHFGTAVGRPMCTVSTLFHCSKLCVSPTTNHVSFLTHRSATLSPLPWQLPSGGACWQQ